jgi:hypothetical protein
MPVIGKPIARQPWRGVWHVAALVVVIASLTAQGRGNAAEGTGAAPAAAKVAEHNTALLTDPISSLSTSSVAWSVSRTDAGCYLLSPRRTDSSNLAFGRHPALGLGLFIVNFGLSVPNDNPGESVTIHLEDNDLSRAGKLAGKALLFIPLDSVDMQNSLAELKENGQLWLMIRHTWITHGGQGLAEAIVKFGQDCPMAGNSG